VGLTYHKKPCPRCKEPKVYSSACCYICDGCGNSGCRGFWDGQSFFRPKTEPPEICPHGTPIDSWYSGGKYLCAICGLAREDGRPGWQLREMVANTLVHFPLHAPLFSDGGGI
jgi:hypothetical protein